MNMNHFDRRPVESADPFEHFNLIVDLAPIRYLGYHFCDDDSQQTMISRVERALSAAHKLKRLRCRFHSGTSTRELDLLGLHFVCDGSISILTYRPFSSAGSLLDIHGDLMTFGIPTMALPVYNWISSRQSIEAIKLEELNQLSLSEREKAYNDGETAWQHHYDSTRTKSIEANNLEVKVEQKTPSDETIKDDCIAVLQPMDVVRGRERHSQSHTGTLLYQCLIDEYRERYDMCETAIDKTILASAIVVKVKEYGGRFLLRKKGETNWSEADDWAAREKVTNAFRGRRKSAAKRLKRINVMRSFAFEDFGSSFYEPKISIREEQQQLDWLVGG